MCQSQKEFTFLLLTWPESRLPACAAWHNPVPLKKRRGKERRRAIVRDPGGRTALPSPERKRRGLCPFPGRQKLQDPCPALPT